MISRLLTFWLLLLLWACQAPESSKLSPNSATDLDSLHLAFDWRPNVLHLGILEAERQGWFKEAGIALTWDTPEIDNYTKKPILRLLDGEVDLAIGPSEHLFAFAQDSDGVKAQAIASLLQSDRSAFAVKTTKGFSRLADLKQAAYLGYHTPLEHEILTAMIEKDGGQANFTQKEPGRLAVWPAFLQDSGDVAWVFLHWEAMQAKQMGIALQTFIPNEHGVPYGYSSLIMAPKGAGQKERDLYRRFLQVLERAYRALVSEAPKDFAYGHANFEDEDFILAAYTDIREHYLSEDGEWGQMDASKWEAYATWLQERDLLELKEHSVKDFYTNQFLD